MIHDTHLDNRIDVIKGRAKLAEQSGAMMFSRMLVELKTWPVIILKFSMWFKNWILLTQMLEHQ